MSVCGNIVYEDKGRSNSTGQYVNRVCYSQTVGISQLVKGMK